MGFDGIQKGGGVDTNNPYNLLVLEDNDDDGDNNEKQGSDSAKSNSTFMQQSMISNKSTLIDSPVAMKNQEASLVQMESLVAHDDCNLSAKGWATINRVLQHGDPTAVGIEDLCYYISHSCENLKASKKVHSILESLSTFVL